MKAYAATYLLLAVVPATVQAFSTTVIGRPNAFIGGARSSVSVMESRMDTDSSTSTGGALVPVKEETVEFTAGIIGGVAGLIVGGPVFAMITAAAANYVSKTESDVADVVQAVSKSSIQIFNYLANLDGKYELLGKARDALQTSLDKLKQQDTIDPTTVSKVENALANTNAKIKEINDEYDLVGAGVTALGVVGDLVEKAVLKANELNQEYALTDKAKTALATAIDKAKEAASRTA